MENINDVTFEVTESKAKLYNKPMALTTTTSKIRVIDCAQAKVTGEAVARSSVGGYLARIAALEAKVADLTERLDELEEIVSKVLIA